MYKSKDEINKVFSDHLNSLELSGLPFDREAVLSEWDNALYLFDNPEG